VGNKRPNAVFGRGLLFVLGTIAAACSLQPPPSPAPPERTGEVSSAVFVNGGFESGTNNTAPPSWTVTTYKNGGVTIQNPQTRAGLNLGTGGTARTVTLVSATGPESQPDATLGPSASLRWPKFGNAVALVNRQGNQTNANSMKQTMTVAAGDIDNVDGLAHVRFVMAPVLQDPGHNPDEQPYFFVQLTNLTKGNQILYEDFNFANQPGVPWQTQGAIKFTDWALVDIAPGSAKLAPGDQVELEIIAAGCSFTQHWGQVYVDGLGSTVPGLFVAGTGPSAANQNTDITYKLVYKNGGTTTANAVKVEFNTPPNTTFTSLSAAGLVCTSPAVGSGGLVSCVVGTLAAGASGNFQVTVHIDNGTAGSVITAGNYNISGAGISPLLGPKVYTNVTNGVTYANLGVTMTSPGSSVPAGGTVTYTIAVTNAGPNVVTGANVKDTLPAQLTGATWTCVGAGGATCTGSGTGSINDSATSIPVNGKLTYTLTATVAPGAAAGQLANVASVSVPAGASDPYPANNSVANYKQITVANGVACNANNQCTSGVCNTPDQKCGYPDGTGPCTGANGSVVCRSGACSVDGTCRPATGCNVDGDCTGGKWCQESSHTCKDKLPNGTAVPTDPPHSNPTLDGNCTPLAGTLTCASGVCDAADDKCGYANGTGPCTSVNAGIVCRSGACSVATSTCIAAAACNGDGDCAAGKWCAVSAHECRNKLPNGSAVPNDPPHTNPTLSGKCTTAAGTLTCASKVCDVADDKCGYADGHGPCDGTTAGNVCRSGACGGDGNCAPSGGCNVDGDCTAGNWCNVSTHTCTAKLSNGSPVPNDPPHTNPTLDGTCTTAAGTLTCVSTVCDTSDNRCGYADGHGPCTATDAAVVCRSSSCSVTGVCRSATGCNGDADCDKNTQFCDTGVHACTAKLANGTSMPTIAGHTPTLDGKCGAEAAAIVCQSAVCDPADNKCGYTNGGGPCGASNGATVCRSGACDPNDSTCGLPDGKGPCANDSVCRSNNCDEAKQVCGSGCKTNSDCASTEYCKSDGACSPKHDDGERCAGMNECKSGACNEQVCDSLLAFGSGVACAVLPGSSSHDAGAAAFGLLLTAAGLVRRRRRVGSTMNDVR
jgi:uncharacterized repeat protein (TIGR01451 family)